MFVYFASNENETNKDNIITGDFNADVGALKVNKYTRKQCKLLVFMVELNLLRIQRG